MKHPLLANLEFSLDLLGDVPPGVLPVPIGPAKSGLWTAEGGCCFSCSHPDHMHVMARVYCPCYCFSCSHLEHMHVPARVYRPGYWKDKHMVVLVYPLEIYSKIHNILFKMNKLNPILFLNQKTINI